MNSGPGVKAAFAIGTTAAAAHVMVWESFMVKFRVRFSSEAVGFC